VKTAFVALDADTCCPISPPCPLTGELVSLLYLLVAVFIVVFYFSTPFQGAGGVKKNPGLLGRDRMLICFRFLCFGKYYPASFFKEVIKEKIESICDGCFHYKSNIGIDRMRNVF